MAKARKFVSPLPPPPPTLLLPSIHRNQHKSPHPTPHHQHQKQEEERERGKSREKREREMRKRKDDAIIVMVVPPSLPWWCYTWALTPCTCHYNYGYNGVSRWGELESGHTTIAFTPLHQHETDEVTGEVHIMKSKHERGPIEICLDYADVDAAYEMFICEP
ncbi:Trigger factor [Bienertia sinuspersici]